MPSLGSETISDNWKFFKNDKNAFVSSQNIFLLLKFLNFCPHYSSHVGKRLDEKVKVIFKFYDVKDWEINNYNTNIDQYLKS